MIIYFRLQRFYSLGLSFGKILEVSNINNIVSALMG